MVLCVKQDKGFTILEVLIALFLFSFLLLGLLGAFLKAYEYSARNEIRNEAVKVVEQELEKYRNRDFDSILPIAIDCTTTTEKVKRQVRSNYVEFKIGKVITEEVPASVKKVEITACWEHKGKEYKYKAQTLITPY
ncbi:MAG: prepilin-type N-terminal cleavage/methylation domain-containing protein [Aquificae bacterium]|nr:prepilin-type N-terminal cleavage/methylation domain-containing protein [Aquificota bacterium]